ncbi:hypothetical protein QBC45DRAFT_394735 [Copromyces sp. CBS 386.78]|nr:hypothetical protein QBC45DRAFT_394735 [Copromyces sp. CBS 386.78]
MAGIVGSLLGNMTKAGEPAPTSVVAIMIVTSASLLWCISSWSGYSRRRFPYKVTIVTDVVFLISFGVFSILLGLPMHNGGTKCPQVKPKDYFAVQTDPLGVLDFSGESNGRVACTKLYLLWVLMLVVCASFVLSAGSVGVITAQEKKLNKALWCARAMGTPVDGRDYHREPSEAPVAGVEEVVSSSPWQLPRPRVHVSTRSHDSVEAADDDDRRGGETYYQNKGPYKVDSANIPFPRASRYDCTPRVDSSLPDPGYGASQARSLGKAVLQEGNIGPINNYNRRATQQNPIRNLQEQYSRAGGLANNKSPKPIPLPVLQARSAALDQLEGRSSAASMDLSDAPYLRDLYHTFMYPHLNSPDLDPDADPDCDSWATFTNTGRYNPQERIRDRKKQRPSGLLYLPHSSNIASSPTLAPDPDLPTHTQTQPQPPAQPQTNRQTHDSYSSSFYSTPSIYDNDDNTHVRFDHRDLPSPDYNLNPPPPRSTSGTCTGDAGLKYSLPPRPRTTLRVVDAETLSRLEGISEESGGGMELEEIPISPLPPAPVWLSGRPSERQAKERREWQPEGPTEVQPRGWVRGRGREQEHEQEVGETRAAGEDRRARITRWPGVWSIGSRSGSRHERHEEREVDGQSTSSKHCRGGGFRARSTRLFSTIGAWLNGIDDGFRSDGTRQRDGHSFRSGHEREGHGWDRQQWDMV